MDVDDFTTQPRVLKILIELFRQEGPITFREFTQACGFWIETSAQLRDKLETWNLITVGWKNKKTQHIELTPYGRDVAQKALEMDKIVERGMRAKGKGS